MAEHGGKESESESGDEGLARIDTRAAAVALALSRTTRSSDLNAKAAAFLEKQGRLADLQMEHLHDERELQHRHGRLKYFRERLAVGLQLLTLTFGAAVVVGQAWCGRPTRRAASSCRLFRCLPILRRAA